MEGTVWTLIPPLLAIALALITKEVYLSLLAGICIGALMYAQGNIAAAIRVTVDVMSNKVAGNICIIIFLVLLGMLVSLMSKSGASKAYGDWAGKNIKTRRGSLFATAAPICIIAPVSSWAAAVSSSLPEKSGLDGFMLFIQAIPYNYYAILTLIMVVLIIAWDFDFGRMKKYEEEYGTRVTGYENDEVIVGGHGKVIDLILPILVLIVFCIGAMLYTGGILEGAGIRDAFANCDSAFSLVIGSFFTIVVTAFLYLPRKVIAFRPFADSLTDGFKAMVPAILILTFAWTLSGICGEGYLCIGDYVKGVISESSMSLAVIPAIFFVVALGLAFSTGTSWGTFAILLPIIVSVFDNTASTLMIVSLASIMAGAVCGDHVSPISDTTILSSTGAGCDHIEHVHTQMPYALLVASICLVCYIIAGFTGNGWLGLFIGIVLLVGVLYGIKRRVCRE